MSAQLEAIAAELDVIEEALDTIVRVNVVKAFFSQKSTQIGIVALVAVGLGVATGVKVAEKRLQAKYDLALEKEVEATREFYSTRERVVVEDLVVPDPEELLAETDGVPSDVKNMKVDYTAMYDVDKDGLQSTEENEFLKKPPAPSVEVAESAKVERKLFTELTPDDLDMHDAATQMLIHEGLPHVISVEDFNENENDWETITITWFAGDGVLVDEREQMIEDVEGIVGQSNLDRFGYLSQDTNIVYVKNPEHDVLIEVVYSDGNYAQEVLGFTHSDEVFERRNRRVRIGDE